MRRKKGAGKPFFLYLPFSMGHVPNLPSQQFKGRSRIGNYGDKLMEGDYHVGRILDTLKELGVDNNTIVVFASDNGPYGEAAREFGNQGTLTMDNSGTFRGELGAVQSRGWRGRRDRPAGAAIQAAESPREARTDREQRRRAGARSTQRLGAYQEGRRSRAAGYRADIGRRSRLSRRPGRSGRCLAAPAGDA